MSLRFALLLAACFNLAGQSAGSRQLSVVVVNAAAKPHKPVAGARVALQRSLTDTRITAGVMPSDRNGRVVFDLPSSFQLAFDIRLEVTDSGDLVLYKPEEGAANARDLYLKHSVTLQLLPRSSPSLLEPGQLEALVSRLSSATPKTAARDSVPATPKEDLDRSLKEWAGRRGFTLAQVKEQLQRWVEDARENPENKTARQKALAEFAAQNFLEAAKLFGRAADADERDLDQAEAERKQAEERVRDRLRRFLDDKIHQAGSYSKALQWNLAGEALDQAFFLVEKYKAQYKGWWQEIYLRREWLHAEDNIQQRLLEAKDPVAQAHAKESQGRALYIVASEARLISDAEAVGYLEESAEALRKALEISASQEDWGEWESVQIALSDTLDFLATLSKPPEAADLWRQALQALTDAAGANQQLQETFQDEPRWMEQLIRNEDEINRQRLFINQNRLFAFEQAFEFGRHLDEFDSSITTQLEQAETYLTTGRYSQCIQQWDEFDELSADLVPLRESFVFACRYAAGDKDASSSAQTLLTLAGGLHKIDWTFDGTRHFLATAAPFAKSRDSWIRLFDRLGAGDGPGLAAAVRDIRKTIVN